MYFHIYTYTVHVYFVYMCIFYVYVYLYMHFSAALCSSCRTTRKQQLSISFWRNKMEKEKVNNTGESVGWRTNKPPKKDKKKKKETISRRRSVPWRTAGFVTTYLSPADEFQQDAAHEPECTHVEHFCETSYINSLVHFFPVTVPLDCGIRQRVGCKVWSVECKV